jgi:hypothetical protein
MPRLTVVLAFVFSTCAALTAQNQQAFDLNAWNKLGDANWRVVDGVVEADKGMGGFLVTPMDYGDFEMAFDFWVSDDANSGVFIRASNPKEITAANSYEVNIFDKRPDQTYRTGAIVNIAKPQAMVNTGGKWNTMEVSARGPKMTVTVNGMRTVDVEHRQFQRGPIALQYGTGVVRFRNVRIKSVQ